MAKKPSRIDRGEYICDSSLAAAMRPYEVWKFALYGAYREKGGALVHHDRR